MTTIKALSFATVAAIMTLSSCQSPEKLATEVQGAWTDTPQVLDSEPGTEVSIIKVYEFMPTEGADGDVVLSAMINVSKAMPQSDSIIAPLTVSTAATATMTGTYKATSYDKIALKLNMSSFNLSVDPAGVSYDFDALADEAAPDMTHLTPVWAEQIKEELTPLVKAAFEGSANLSSVKITGSLMQAEIDATDVTLRKNQ